TCRLRRWSIGGLVSCANRWRRYEVTGRERPASGGSAVSSRVEEVGSWPVAAEGRRRREMSSRVKPAATWRAVRLSVGGGTGTPGSRARSVVRSQRAYGRLRASRLLTTAP